MPNRPTLLNSCASAATAAEARFRIDASPQAGRAARVVALDEGAEAVVSRLAEQTWHRARFLSYSATTGRVEHDSELADLFLRTPGGDDVRLSDELIDADFMMMIATADDGANAASAIGNACTLRGIMTAGLILGEGRDVSAAISALRPYARVLLVTQDEDDATEVLSAIGA
jgi:hypothetical protein